MRQESYRHVAHVRRVPEVSTAC
uniref:Uncharacterized protein n=1 Tax=Anguilla anguilla TaxID=7936 RepID=A0A0E9VC79_ANGAN